MSPQKKKDLTFAELVLSIRQANDLFLAQASKAVNISLTLRNWAIGYYIERYERLGVDRAKYGERLMDDLSETLRKLGLSRCDRRELYRYRQFYLTYPQIVEAAAPQLTAVLQNKQQWQLLAVKTKQKIAGSIVESPTPQLTNSGQTLLSRLSFTHFSELLEIQDSLKRVFYEVECIRGNWSVLGRGNLVRGSGLGRPFIMGRLDRMNESVAMPWKDLHKAGVFRRIIQNFT